MTVWQYNRDTGASQQDVAPGNAIDWMDARPLVRGGRDGRAVDVNSTIAGREPEYLGGRARQRAVLHRARHADAPRPRVSAAGVPAWRPPRRDFQPPAVEDRFGGDPSIVGRRVRLDDAEAYTVVGVLPPAFELRLFDNRATRPEPLLWLPKPGFEQFEPNLRGTGFWNVLGRLRPGVSLEQARAEFDALSAQLAREYPQTNGTSPHRSCRCARISSAACVTCCRCCSARRRFS